MKGELLKTRSNKYLPPPDNKYLDFKTLLVYLYRSIISI